MTHNYIALYKMLPQYSDKASKSKSGSRLNKLTTTIKGEVFTQQVISTIFTIFLYLSSYVKTS